MGQRKIFGRDRQAYDIDDGGGDFTHMLLLPNLHIKCVHLSMCQSVTIKWAL